MSEGITIPYTPASPPRKPVPEPIKVSDRLDLRYARLKSLLEELHKGFELIDYQVSARDKATDPTVKQVSKENILRQIAELEKKWQLIYKEVQALNNGEFHGDMPLKDKQDIGKSLVVVLIPPFPSPNFTNSVVKHDYDGWMEQLRYET